jgi:hypothetical protein
VFKIDAALLLLRSVSLSYGIISPPRKLSRSSSSSVRLPRRSLLRIVEGRRANNDGRCDPRVDSAAEASLNGRMSFELARRGRLAERGTGEGDLGGGVEG